jgi:AcrR family transcriptional regulator
MDDIEFDRTLIAGAFSLAARDGWAAVSVDAAAREVGLAVDRARGRFAGRDAILLRFGRLADAAALTGVPTDGSVREKLFDILMRRFDALQEHRAGIVALLRALPGSPSQAVLLATATAQSMAWMLEGAGVASSGLPGTLRAKGLAAAWLYALRAWERDDSPDLGSTMAALDRALARAEQIGQWFGRREAPSGPKPFPEDPAGEPVPAASSI